MPLEAIKPKTISGLDALDTFLYAGIQEYVLGDVTKPTAGHTNLPIWTKNDNLTQAGIRMHILDVEKDYLRSCSIKCASDIWTELKTRHRQKDSTQTSLVNDVLSISIEHNGEMVTKAAQIREICKHIFEIGTLNEDKLARVILLRALSSELRYVCNKYEDDATSTPTDIVQSLEKAKTRWDEETKKTCEVEERANAARARGKHRTNKCWGAGGAMEGKCEEVLKRRAVRCKDEESKADKPSSTKPVSKPRFAMKDASGKAVYFTIADDSADSAATAINEVTPNSNLEELYKVYHARRDSNTSDFSMFTDPDTHTALITASNSMGNIHIHSNSGHIFILWDVLYVLQASMCLLSIEHVVDLGYCTLFADDGFSIVDIKSQTTTIMGTRHGKKLYSLDGAIISHPTAQVATTQLPPASLETWHG
ncbi:hypothetical protein B0H19DRAFT_1255842 [Mycena capillaripes]|nr:hypothetical protein B0H19DRAFT_1255842 [Mycena capillaripes]